MILRLSSCKDYRERSLIFHFSRLSLSSKSIFGDFDVCYLFYRENLTSSYKCNRGG